MQSSDLYIVIYFLLQAQLLYNGWLINKVLYY